MSDENGFGTACRNFRETAILIEEKVTAARIVNGVVQMDAATAAHMARTFRKVAEYLEIVDGPRKALMLAGFEGALKLPLTKLLRLWLMRRLARAIP